ncbi:MAG: bifunctional isocitrate dehydrogenase kinase/phosphatase [Anaerolineae bacterium]
MNAATTSGQTVEAALAPVAAGAILSAFDTYQTEYRLITQRSQSRFETRDWLGANADAVARLELYPTVIRQIVADIRSILGDHCRDRAVWRLMKERYTELIGRRDDIETAETFFNSVTRRIFATVGVDPQIEYVASEVKGRRSQDTPLLHRYDGRGGLAPLLRAILADHPFNAPYADLERDVRLAAARIEASLAERELGGVDAADVVRHVFYRNKAAYIIARLHCGDKRVPLALCLLNDERGITIDAVLLTADEVSILFSFTRSYFHVEVESPYELIEFLKSIMPRKPMSELYTSIGFNKHGKTELYRELLAHLAHSDSKFEIARGEKGMVMLVFTMPSFDVVFKIIKDRFAYPKKTTRDGVMERYQLVFKHDKAGRLVDAQEFEHLEFDRARFTPELVEEMLAIAANTVTVTDDKVIIKHLYTERRLTPLNIFIKEATGDALYDAIVDYGVAIKDLAATNIFPGDLLLKNFGVTRHSRIVFYDYDELCLVTDCRFRALPDSDDAVDEFRADLVFYVDEHDIFPEQFEKFLGLPLPQRKIFMAHHRDLLDPAFWNEMKARHDAGEVMDIFPYKQSQRLHHDRSQ